MEAVCSHDSQKRPRLQVHGVVANKTADGSSTRDNGEVQITMKTVDVNSLQNTERDVRCPMGGFTSLRPILAKDGMGFSLHKTIIPKGKPQAWHYKHHLEACYCVTGEGVLTNCETGEQFSVLPDTVYILDNHDRHTFEAKKDVVLISIFNPPVHGREVHLEDGSYPLA